MNPPTPADPADDHNDASSLRLPSDPRPDDDSPGRRAYLAKMEVERAQQREVCRRFGLRLFDRLGQLGITWVMVTFNGSGDSGQIEEITVWMANREDDAPTPSEPAFDDHSLYSAVERFIYDQLNLDHDGWELDAGSRGKYVLDVANHVVCEEFAARLYIPGPGDDDGTVWPSPRYHQS